MWAVFSYRLLLINDKLVDKTVFGYYSLPADFKVASGAVRLLVVAAFCA